MLRSICLLLILISTPLRAQTPAAPSLETLVIVTAQGQQKFDVEVMRTEPERMQGLMHRRYLPTDRGMLFDFERVEPVAMWMQNTFIPLDMLFIRADGTIARITENTEPLSTRILPSGEPVKGVLELNGGTATRLHIKAGDKVVHGMFKGN